MSFINKKILRLGLFFAGSLASTAYAVAPGFYMGLMLGPATNTSGTQEAVIEDSTATTPVTPRSNQFGTRVFMGYKINTYAGVEGGVSLFSKINYNTKNVPTCTTPSVRVRDLDVAGKGTLPWGDFDVFVKAGVAYAYITESGAFFLPKPGETCGQNHYISGFKPTVSAGASYTLSQSWVTDISWNRIMVGGIPKNIDFYGIGISYHFVDRYCGQFLCDD